MSKGQFQTRQDPGAPNTEGPASHTNYRETSAQKEGSKRTQVQDTGCQEMWEQGLEILGETAPNIGHG